MTTTPTTYAEAVAIVDAHTNNPRTRLPHPRIAPNTTLRTDLWFDGTADTWVKCAVVKFHNTDIVTFMVDGRIMLNSGGFHTVTTKERLNRYLAGWRVMQKAFVWTVYGHGGAIPFEDGMMIGKLNPHRSRPEKFEQLTLDLRTPGALPNVPQADIDALAAHCRKQGLNYRTIRETPAPWQYLGAGAYRDTFRHVSGAVAKVAARSHDHHNTKEAAAWALLPAEYVPVHELRTAANGMPVIVVEYIEFDGYSDSTAEATRIRQSLQNLVRDLHEDNFGRTSCGRWIVRDANLSPALL